MDVSGIILEKSDLYQNDRLMNALDGKRVQNPLQNQAQILDSYFQTVALSIDKIYRDFNIPVQSPQFFFQLIEWLCKYKVWLDNNRQGLDPQFECDLDVIDSAVSVEIGKGSFSELLDQLEPLQGRLNKKLQNLTLTETNSEQLRDELDLMQKLISIRLKIQNPDTPLGYSKAHDSWNKIQYKILEIHERRKDALQKCLNQAQ